MKKSNLDAKNKYNVPHKFINLRYKKSFTVENFSVEKLNNFSSELIELFKLIQGVRHDRISLQEEYNKCRLKLNNDRMNLESEIIKIKKYYHSKISALQEEYNSVKSNNIFSLKKFRDNL